MSALGTLRFDMAAARQEEELQARVSLNPTVTHAVVGETFSVDVYISNVANLYGWEFRLFYETHAIDAVDVTEGQFLRSFAEQGSFFGICQINDAYNSTHGQVWVYCTLIGLPSHTATGNGVLATVTFKCTASGAVHMALYYPLEQYPVLLSDINANLIPCMVTDTNVFSIGPDTVPLDISIDAGALYFPEEWAQFYFMTTLCGASVAPTSTQVWLYDPYGTKVSLGCENIATGFYRVWYHLPLDAYAGTYAIVVEATYITDAVQAYGTGFKTYQMSSTLNSRLMQLSGTMALIQTEVGVIYTDMSTIKLQVTAIDGNVATIQTTLGTLQGTITSVNNNIATIRTDIGTIKADISAIKANTTPKALDWNTVGLYISLALIASIAIVLVVLFIFLRARFRTEATTS